MFLFLFTPFFSQAAFMQSYTHTHTHTHTHPGNAGPKPPSGEIGTGNQSPAEAGAYNSTIKARPLSQSIYISYKNKGAQMQGKQAKHCRTTKQAEQHLRERPMQLQEKRRFHNPTHKTTYFNALDPILFSHSIPPLPTPSTSSYHSRPSRESPESSQRY